jgi:LacI family transcriptional regulator
MLAASGARSRESLELLTRQGVPVILIDRKVDGLSNEVVHGESRRPARILTEHLIEHGHSRIGLITGPEDVSTAREREIGFRDAMARARLRVEDRFVFHTPYTRGAGYRAAQSLLAVENGPTAVVTGNNFLAFGLIDAARERGRRVPDDLAVVTFDDVEIVAEEPFFTCAAQPAEAMGRAAVERLITRVKGHESPVQEVVLRTEVRIRRSCGCTA